MPALATRILYAEIRQVNVFSEKMCLSNGKYFTFGQPLDLHNKNYVTLHSVRNSWCKSLNFPLSSNFSLRGLQEKQKVNRKRIPQLTIPGGLWLSHPLGMVLKGTRPTRWLLMARGKRNWKMSQWSWNAALLVPELCWGCTPLNICICLEEPPSSCFCGGIYISLQLKPEIYEQSITIFVIFI